MASKKLSVKRFISGTEFPLMSVTYAVAQIQDRTFHLWQNGSGAKSKMGENGPRLARVTAVLPLAHENG
jgi:hypothetical protein